MGAGQKGVGRLVPLCTPTQTRCPSEQTDTAPTLPVWSTSAPTFSYRRTTSALGWPNRLCRPALTTANTGRIASTNAVEPVTALAPSAIPTARKPSVVVATKTRGTRRVKLKSAQTQTTPLIVKTGHPTNAGVRQPTAMPARRATAGITAGARTTRCAANRKPVRPSSPLRATAERW